jgi:group I intron endonuclease
MKGYDRMRAIYNIINIENKKRYIGETMDVKRRWEEHEEELENNQHHSYKLQQDWNKYGKDKFKFEILAVLDESINNYIDKYILLLYEGYYIKEYDSIVSGYNIENTLIEIMNDKK